MKVILATLGLLQLACMVLGQDGQPGNCPLNPADTFGTCDERCGKGCPLGELCCSNGCGHLCKKACPKFGCKTCVDGNVIGADGCATCECCDRCKCKCGPNERCMCKDVVCASAPCDRVCECEPECPMLSFCPFDCIQEDKNGCEFCAKDCEPCPPVITIFCPFGNERDERGCPLGICKKDPCRNGAYLTTDGLPIDCGSLGNTCPRDSFCFTDSDSDSVCCKCPPECEMACKYGKVRDKNGCKICECNPNPCATVLCPKGTKCVPDDVICKKFPCPPVAKCVPDCEPLLCDLDCGKLNFKVDDNGCRICECNADPCKERPCPCGYQCEVVEAVCVTEPCNAPPGRVCTADKRCPYGFPLLKGGSTWYCGRGGTRCPPGYFCEIEPADRWAVCCECGPKCDLYCPYGNYIDEKGCEVCKCKPNPCDAKKCPEREECVLMDVYCVRAPCPPIPVCKETCSLPAEPGQCKGYFPKWFYNSATGKCETFIYGGCGGNGNRFDSKADCLMTCKGNGPLDQILAEN